MVVVDVVVEVDVVDVLELDAACGETDGSIRPKPNLCTQQEQMYATAMCGFSQKILSNLSLVFSNIFE